MKKWRYGILILIATFGYYLRYIRYGTLISLPESDMYYYINIYNGLLNGSSEYGIHPAFNLFMYWIGKFTNFDFHSLYVFTGLFLSLFIIVLIYYMTSKLKNYRVGLLSAFFFAITPVAIIRNGQTIAETLAFIFLILYIYFLFDISERFSKRALLLIPLFVSMFFIHNLTAAVALLITCISYFIYMLYKKDFLKASLIVIVSLLFISYIYFTPLENLPEFKEYYLSLYKAIKEYISLHSFGRPEVLEWSKYDLLFPTILLSIGGLVMSFLQRRKEDVYMLILFFSLFFMTQAFRINFYFIPHRFLIYLLIPTAYFASIFVVALTDNITKRNRKYSILVIIGLIFISINSYNFEYDFNFLMNDEDFTSLSWSRENIIDDQLTTYSKINNRSQNKFEAVSGHEIDFKNNFFNTGIVDYSLFEIVSQSFDIPIGQNPPSNSKVYYASSTNNYSDFIKLNKGDRCLTSLEIINTFWHSPDYIAICDAASYQKGADIAKDLNLPLILYSNERYDIVIETLESLNPKIILIDEIDVLIKAFEYKGMEYTFSLPQKQCYAPVQDAYLFYDKYDPSIIEGILDEYLYVSKEALEDFSDLRYYCDQTNLLKLYDAGLTDYYTNI